MEKDTSVYPHPANSQTSAFGSTSVASPIFKTHENGQSVENVQSETHPPHKGGVREDLSPHYGGDAQRAERVFLPIEGELEGAISPHYGGDAQRAERVFLSWFVIRATQGRAQAVYDTLTTLPDFPYEVYIPRYHYETLQLINGNPEKHIEDGILDRSLVFVRMPLIEFRKLIHAENPYPFIKGLTPYYNHFQVSSYTGRNDYLIVPDHQFNNFRTLLESQDTHILIDQTDMPTYLTGKKVEIVDGPFTGITGTLLRWKGLRRVFIQLDQLGTFATGFVRTCDFRLLEE